MKIGRNDLCPCGSGRKYKRCCLQLERSAAGIGGEGVALRAAAAESPSWLMDVLPMPVAIHDDPAARPAVLLIVAGGLILHSDILRRPSAEAVELADEMARQLEQVVEQFEVCPKSVIVRDAKLAHSLGASLAGKCDIAVHEGSLDDLFDAADSLREYLGGSGEGHTFASAARTWAGWGLRDADCAELFRAAAQYFRAAPWRHLWDSEYLEISAPSGSQWFAAVMGRGGQEFGLALYADRAELESVFSLLHGARIKAPVLSLLFEDGREVSREVRKEISRAGWEVAGPAAYPMLIALNTRAGGITCRQVADLTGILRAVVAFTGAHGVDLAEGRPVAEFSHEESGVTVRSEHHRKSEIDLPPVGRLEPGGVEGPGSHPEAALDNRTVYEDPDTVLECELTVVARYVRSLEERGLTSPTVTKHGTNAELFVEYLVMSQGVPLAAVHEYDLRVFLFDWYPRKVHFPRNQALALRGSLRRFFRYLASEEGLWLRAAHAVLGEKQVFESRWDGFPGGFFWDEDVQRWRAGAAIDLHRRLMIHDDRLARTGAWGATMGSVEALLEGELQRRWLLWRDDLLRTGTTDPDELWQRLIAQQEAWEMEPHPGFDGRSPATAIATERRDTELSLDR